MLKLFSQALIKVSAGIILMAVLLFLPAGTLHFCQAWLLLALLFIPMLFVGTFMLFKAPDLLKRRLDVKEKRSTQQGVIKFSALLFIAAFIIAGLDHRFNWSVTPAWLSYAASAVFLIGYGLYAEVLRENTWLSRTIKVDEKQQVISSGLYGIVRHPMYSATLLMFLSMPLILGSWWAFAILLLYIPIIVCRIFDEEELLRNELNGYSDYCQHLRWRLIPFVW